MTETRRSSTSAFRRYADLVVGLLVLIVLIDLGLIVYRKHQGSSVEVDRSRQVNYFFRVDPNTAREEDLADIPGLTQTAARKITAYRTKHQDGQSGKVVFNNLEDLARVPGLSERMLQKATPFLTFPPRTPTTIPAAEH